MRRNCLGETLSEAIEGPVRRNVSNEKNCHHSDLNDRSTIWEKEILNPLKSFKKQHWCSRTTFEGVRRGRKLKKKRKSSAHHFCAHANLGKIRVIDTSGRKIL